MKLVEILARELKEWPFAENLPLTQAYNGSIFVSCADRGEGEDTLRTGIILTIADDISSDEPVTHAQWEVERARISKVEEFNQQVDDLLAEQAVSQYEQELWDKVASKTLEQLISIEIGSPTETPFDLHASVAGRIADAFMAERAKRLKGVK